MKNFLIDLLKPFAEWCYAVVVAVPLPAVRILFLGMLAALIIWMLTLPVQRDKDKNGKEKAWYTDLRVMGIGLILLQSVFYIFL